MDRVPDVLIAGAGIVGAACAWELAKAGAKVDVVEEGVVGGGATAAGMGHLVVLDDSPAELALSKLSVALWRSVSAELPPAAEFCACGTLWVAADEEDLLIARQKLSTYRAQDLLAELLDGAQIQEAEPHLRPGLAGGLLASGDAAVYAPVAARWMLEQSRARIVRGSVARFTEGGVVLSDGSARSAGAVVCALGASATEILPEVPVRPRKGHLAITDRYPGMLRRQVVELGYMRSAHGESADSVAFNVQPRPTGQLLIGSSRQYGVTHSGIDDAILRRMLERAFGYMPALRQCSAIRTWTGFRASTPDHLPLIGPYRDGLFLATGHEGLGVTTSLGTAKILTALVCGGVPPIAAEPYLPGRFDA